MRRFSAWRDALLHARPGDRPYPWSSRAVPRTACGAPVRLVLESLEPRLVLADNLTIDTGTVLNSITQDFLGLNYVAYWDPLQGSAASRQALANAGIQVLRFAGGEPANYYDWANPYADRWSTTSTSDLWDYASQVGARLLLQTNPTTNHGNDPSGQHAADWVRYTLDNGIDAPYWEIGNENDGSGNNGATAVRFDYDWAHYQPYLDAWNEQAQAMKAVNPNIQVLGNAGTNEYFWWGLHSLDMFLNETGNVHGTGLVDGVSVHYYPLYQMYPGWANVEALSQNWYRRMDVIQGFIAANDTRNLPVFITETNDADGPGSGSIVATVASALANADLIGAYRNSGVQQVDFFGSIHSVGNSFGILYGVNDWSRAETDSPKYFLFPIWSHAGNQVLGVDGLTDPGYTLSAYASQSTNGNVQVVLFNKTGAPRTVNLSFAGFDPTGLPVNIYELKGSAGGIWDSTVTYNGVTNPDVTSPDGLPGPLPDQATASTYSRTLPAYSMTMVEFVAGPGPQRPVVRVAAPASGAKFAFGRTLTLSADVRTAGGGISRIAFFHDGTLIGQALGGRRSITWANALPGTYTITAVAYTDAGGVAASAPVRITVTMPAFAPELGRSPTAPTAGQETAVVRPPSVGSSQAPDPRPRGATGWEASHGMVRVEGRRHTSRPTMPHPNPGKIEVVDAASDPSPLPTNATLVG